LTQHVEYDYMQVDSHTYRALGVESVLNLAFNLFLS